MIRRLVPLALGAAILLGAFSVDAAGATIGNLDADQSCGGGYVTASVGLLRASDTVQIVSTIPGIAGLTQSGYTIGDELQEVWAHEWRGNDRAGTVTLRLFHEGQETPAFSDSVTVAPVLDCPPPPTTTTTSTSTTTSTTSTTLPPAEPPSEPPEPPLPNTEEPPPLPDTGGNGVLYVGLVGALLMVAGGHLMAARRTA
jgi:hypothetical protein